MARQQTLWTLPPQPGLQFLRRSIKLLASRLKQTSVTSLHPICIQILWSALFILFQTVALHKPLQNENSCHFNVATVQAFMCIFHSLLGFWFCLYPCICGQLFCTSSGFSANTSRLIGVCWEITRKIKWGCQNTAGFSSTCQDPYYFSWFGRAYFKCTA